MIAQHPTKSITISPFFGIKNNGTTFFFIFSFFMISLHLIMPTLLSIHYLSSDNLKKLKGSEITSRDIFSLFLGSHQLLMVCFTIIGLFIYCAKKNLGNCLIMTFSVFNMINGILYIIFVLLLIFLVIIDNSLQDPVEWVLFTVLCVVLFFVFSLMVYWSTLLIHVSRRHTLGKYNSHQTILIHDSFA